MAFGDEIGFSMWNHNVKIQNLPECSHSDNNDFGHCKSICCYEKDYTTNNSLISNYVQNVFKKYKVIISFFDVLYLNNFVFDWNFISNKSLPNRYILFNVQNNLYINLVWIIKSNR